jgi:hypothetical protein
LGIVVVVVVVVVVVFGARVVSVVDGVLVGVLVGVSVVAAIVVPVVAAIVVPVVDAGVVPVVDAGVVPVVAAGVIGVVGEVSTIYSGFFVNLMKASWSVVGRPGLLLAISGFVKNQRFFDDLFLPQTEKMPFCFRVIPNFAQIHFFSLNIGYQMFFGFRAAQTTDCLDTLVT